MRHVTVVGWIALGSLALAATGCIRDEPEPLPPSARAAPDPEHELTTYRQPSVSVVTFRDYIDDPMKYVGTIVVVEATVEVVVSDRVFWVNGGDEGWALAVVRESAPRDQMLDIRVGDRLRFNALVLPSSARSAIVGPLAPGVREAISSTPAFLAVYWADVTIAGRR